MVSVLIVDDEPFLRTSVLSLCDWAAHDLEFRHEAANGREALDTLAAHPEIALVLVDLSMPVLDGIGFLTALPGACAAAGRPVPTCLVLSSYQDFPLVRQAFTLGAQDYLLKSELDPDDLLARLKTAAAGLEPATEAAEAEALRRQHLGYLKEKVLRDALDAPVPDQWEGLFATLGIALGAGVRVLTVTIEDCAVLLSKMKEDEVSGFADQVRRSLAQVLTSAGTGEVVPVSTALWVILFHPKVGTDPDRFPGDLGAWMARYLNLKVACRLSPPLDSPLQITEVYQEFQSQKKIESRIVVLAKRYIRDHFTDEGLNLDTLSGHVGVSRNHLSWEFSRETGETLISYLARVRIEEAKRLLTDPKALVSEVCFEVGYPNVEHFSRVFKKVTGISPAKWSDVMSQEF